jgi:dihydroorotase-like cyclic amidohydrolase
MKVSKIALISRRIICEEYSINRFSAPLNGAVLIKDELIEEILRIEDFKAELLAQEYVLEDLGNMCIFPGIIDLNVSFNADGASTVTRQAISGGVTTLATTDNVSGDIYTDIAKIYVLDDKNIEQIESLLQQNIFAFKSYLVPQGPNSHILTDIPKALEKIKNVPLIIHPELATLDMMYQATPFRLVEPEKRVYTTKIVIHEEKYIKASKFSLESSDEEEQDDYEHSESASEEFNPDNNFDIIINDFTIETEELEKKTVSKFDSMTLKVPEREKKRTSLPNLLGSENILLVPAVKSLRHNSVQFPGITKPIPIQDIPFIEKGILVEQAYQNHISNFPTSWEIAAIKKIMSFESSCQVHFCNVCSSEAIEIIKQFKTTRSVTCETSLPYLYFSELDVKPGDTRYKLNPPIRDYQNNRNLWQMLKNNEIDCISSYHQPVSPPSKFIGDFKRAVNGVISTGFTLQTIWTRLRTQITVENESFFLVLLGLLLSTSPARIFNIQGKGGIKKGKYADLVVWDPESKSKITKTQDKFPEMSPLIGEELYGAVHRTYLRGNLVYSKDTSVAYGQVLNKFSY